jgi:hypothetical protein
MNNWGYIQFVYIYQLFDFTPRERQMQERLSVLCMCSVKNAMLLAPGLPGALFLKLWKTQISNFKKFQKIPRGSQMYILWSCKFSIRNTLVCRVTKKTNWTNFGRKKGHCSCSQICFLFFLGQNTRYFVLQFYTMVVYIVGSIHVVFLIFFETF